MNFFDLHADTPLLLAQGKSELMAVDILNHPFENYIQTFAVWINDGDAVAFETYKDRLKATLSYCNKNNINLLDNNQFLKNGIILSVENAGFLSDNPKLLERLYNDGVKMLSLTWNGDNAFAGGANGAGGGISEKGVKIIREINRLGIALDVSHLSPKATLEGIMLADRVLASHSCCDAVFHHKRNLSDEALIAIKKKDGIVGLCFYPEFLGEKSAYNGLINNVKHMLELGMSDNIALGSDFDGADMAPELSKTSHIPQLFNAFLKAGFKKSLIEAIFYQNALAFFGKMCENK